MFTIGGYEYVIPLMVVMFMFMYKFSVPFAKLDNQLHKITGADFTKWRSFMHESIRGSTIIRAFNQEMTFKGIENGMVDLKTRNTINHHSAWCYFNIRMTWTS